MRGLFTILLAACGGGGSAAAPPAPAPLDAAIASDASARNRITVSLAPPRGPGLAVRCRLGGSPLSTSCRLTNGTIAIDGGGRVYAIDARSVRRYRVTAANETMCELAADPSFGDGGTLAKPTLQPIPQRADGTMYLSSSESWQLAAGAGTTMYYVEYTRGVHRVDAGKVEPVCPQLPGVKGLMISGKDALIARGTVERLALRDACTPHPAGYAGKARMLFPVQGEVWAENSGKVVRYGKTGAVVATIGGDDDFAPGGFCSVIAVAGCGTDACVVDHNCMKVERFALDGTFVHEYRDEELFAIRPHALTGAATGKDGALWLAAMHKDGDECEGAIYRLPR